MNLLLTVSTGEADGPTHVIVTITPALAADIRRCADVVQELEVYRLSKFDYSCDWGVLEDDALPDTFTPDIWEAVTVLNEVEAALIRTLLPVREGEERRYGWRTECELLNITRDDCYWTAYIKHTDIALTTSDVPLTLLDTVAGGV